MDGVVHCVSDREEELVWFVGEKGVEVDGWMLGRAEGFEREFGNVVYGHELDSESRALNFRFGFYEDVSAVAAALVALGSEEGRDGEQVVDEPPRADLFSLLDDAGRSRPALGAKFVNGLGVGDGIYKA